MAVTGSATRSDMAVVRGCIGGACGAAAVHERLQKLTNGK